MKIENCKTRKTAIRRNPQACKIVKVCGGYAIFDFMSDYEIWANQK